MLKVDGTTATLEIPANEFWSPDNSSVHEVAIGMRLFRTASDTRAFTHKPILVDIQPRTEIVCEIGCDGIRFNQTVVLSTECRYCRTLEPRQLVWTLIADEQLPEPTVKRWPTMFSVAGDNHTIVIPGRTFKALGVVINCTVELVSEYWFARLSGHKYNCIKYCEENS